MYTTLYAIYGSRKNDIGHEFVTYLAGMDEQDVVNRFKYMCGTYETVRVEQAKPIETGDDLTGILSQVLLFWRHRTDESQKYDDAKYYQSLSYITTTIETIYFWSPMLHALQAMKK